MKNLVVNIFGIIGTKGYQIYPNANDESYFKYYNGSAKDWELLVRYKDNKVRYVYLHHDIKSALPGTSQMRGGMVLGIAVEFEGYYFGSISLNLIPLFAEVYEMMLDDKKLIIKIDGNVHFVPELLTKIKPELDIYITAISETIKSELKDYILPLSKNIKTAEFKQVRIDYKEDDAYINSIFSQYGALTIKRGVEKSNKQEESFGANEVKFIQQEERIKKLEQALQEREKEISNVTPKSEHEAKYLEQEKEIKKLKEQLIRQESKNEERNTTPHEAKSKMEEYEKLKAKLKNLSKIDNELKQKRIEFEKRQKEEAANFISYQNSIREQLKKRKDSQILNEFEDDFLIKKLDFEREQLIQKRMFEDNLRHLKKVNEREIEQINAQMKEYEVLPKSGVKKTIIIIAILLICFLSSLIYILTVEPSETKKTTMTITKTDTVYKEVKGEKKHKLQRKIDVSIIETMQTKKIRKSIDLHRFRYEYSLAIAEVNKERSYLEKCGWVVDDTIRKLENELQDHKRSKNNPEILRIKNTIIKYVSTEPYREDQTNELTEKVKQYSLDISVGKLLLEHQTDARFLENYLYKRKSNLNPQKPTFRSKYYQSLKLQ